MNQSFNFISLVTTFVSVTTIVTTSNVFIFKGLRAAVVSSNRKIEDIFINGIYWMNQLSDKMFFNYVKYILLLTTFHCKYIYNKELEGSKNFYLFLLLCYYLLPYYEIKTKQFAGLLNHRCLLPSNGLGPFRAFQNGCKMSAEIHNISGV